MPDGRLVLRLWLSTFASFLPLMVIMALVEASDDGFAWPTLGDLLPVPLVWAVLALLGALYVHGALIRRARGTGIPVTVAALAETQERTFPAGPPARLRTLLDTSERAFAVMGGEERLEFRWRPFRGRQSVAGSVTFEPSGEARVWIRAGEGLTSMQGVRRASAFVALCQMARMVGAE
ncbi:hypothetical protein [Streptomyces diastatochromogenes]|uniref:Uncharacterized protein n=1 Tax=Streptomyces diastatochromogenes TaxID=42236 RepID=A0A233SWH1_STRDA|nr:hypothetical protein [Streptomyces diastatochromogenes]OXY99998.1 hypothetical protein BEK98_02055 [Streptomyces diastatochromogenes]